MLLKDNEYMVYRFKITGKSENKMISWIVFKRWMTLVYIIIILNRKFSSSLTRYNKSLELSNKMSMSNFKKNLGILKRTDDKIINGRIKQILYMVKIINESSFLKELSDVIEFFKEDNSQG